MRNALTIAIPTYRREQVLLDTLQSLAEALNGREAEVLIIDQNPAGSLGVEDALERVCAEHGFTRIRQDEPSLPRARNTALARARHDVVLFVDDDVLLPQHVFVAHLRHYAETEVHGVTGQAYLAEGWGDASHDMPPENAQTHFSRDKAGPTDTFIGCNHSVRRSAMMDAGGYDESFVASAHTEDFDAGHRLSACGRMIVYDPEAWLIHRKTPTGGCRVPGSAAPEWTHTANLMLYAWRYRARRSGLFAQYVRRALCAGPFRKEVLIRPWLGPIAWLGFLRGAVYGYRHRAFSASLRDDERKTFFTKRKRR